MTNILSACTFMTSFSRHIISHPPLVARAARAAVESTSSLCCHDVSTRYGKTGFENWWCLLTWAQNWRRLSERRVISQRAADLQFFFNLYWQSISGNSSICGTLISFDLLASTCFRLFAFQSRGTLSITVPRLMAMGEKKSKWSAIDPRSVSSFPPSNIGKIPIRGYFGHRITTLDAGFLCRLPTLLL